jgi:hypothetical protein
VGRIARLALLVYRNLYVQAPVAAPTTLPSGWWCCRAALRAFAPELIFSLCRRL